MLEGSVGLDLKLREVRVWARSWYEQTATADAKASRPSKVHVSPAPALLSCTIRLQKRTRFVERSMTEGEWLACSDPTAMPRFLRHRASDRQYRLFAVACVRDELARAQAGK
jgi:hypothetical protein